jgi:hypothetical protein
MKRLDEGRGVERGKGGDCMSTLNALDTRIMWLASAGRFRATYEGDLYGAGGKCSQIEGGIESFSSRSGCRASRFPCKLARRTTKYCAFLLIFNTFDK